MCDYSCEYCRNVTTTSNSDAAFDLRQFCFNTQNYTLTLCLLTDSALPYFTSFHACLFRLHTDLM